MSTTKSQKFEFGERPDAISDTPRDSKHGRVVSEVGVFERGSGRDYWKVYQRIEDGSDSFVRVGYYAGKGDDWSWSQDALMLTPEIHNQLHSRAVTAGLLSE